MGFSYVANNVQTLLSDGIAAELSSIALPTGSVVANNWGFPAWATIFSKEENDPQNDIFQEIVRVVGITGDTLFFQNPTINNHIGPTYIAILDVAEVIIELQQAIITLQATTIQTIETQSPELIITHPNANEVDINADEEAIAENMIQDLGTF